ncbi:hypothetical protein JD844_022926 [Phrynosoma platyrhinos]|uniref:RRM domain-containing protein n=1 Tax=Phrynosoma platyrhinos TaxID=52577 RepID=A0ABQ7SVS6_PHRPL|nr:hypothetical protein JD844_022926 [Phrynosoma platyrhinos]
MSTTAKNVLNYLLPAGYQAVWGDVKTNPEQLEHKSGMNGPKQETRSHMQGSSFHLLINKIKYETCTVVHKTEYIFGDKYWTISLLTSGYRTALNECHTELSQSQEHDEYVSSTSQKTNSPQCKHLGYSSTFSELVVRQPKSFVSYSGVTRAEQETKVTTYIRAACLLQVEQLPDLSSLETSDTRSQESVSRRLSVVSEFPFVQQQLFRLFDLIPGLEACETYQGLYSKRVYAMIQYSNVASAIYAKNRLNGFEYPFGNRLLVTFIEDETDQNDLIQEIATDLVNSELSSTILKDDSVLQLLGSSESQIPTVSLQTDAALPACKRKAPPDSSVRERLFILFDPHPLSQDILENVLCRFGSFINAYIIPGENMAFAMFAERASASDTIAALHGKTVNGVKLKVKLADLPIENSSKS